METGLLEDLIVICGKEYVLYDLYNLKKYGKDESIYHGFPFEVVVKPGSPQEISAIMKACTRTGTPVTPRGGGSGVTGGALPVAGGVVLSLERLNKILSIDELNRQVTAEAGVITAALCSAVEERQLYFPVAPSSSYASFIGGNVAENAGSVNSCKYGNTGQYVLNLEVVLPDGDIIWTGANVSKNSSGINLTQLFVSSEGVLGIITKVVYRLLPLPTRRYMILAAFDDLENACDVILDIKRSNVIPCSLELIGEKALQITASYLHKPQPLMEESVKVHLLIGIEEVWAELVEHCLEKIDAILARRSCREVLVASSPGEIERLSRIRYNIGSAMTAGGRRYRDIDICIPISFLYEYILHVECVARKYDLEVVIFGHALDANLHAMILRDEAPAHGSPGDLGDALREIYQFALSNGGVISGEHGVGLLQKEFMNIQYSSSQLGMMRNIKKVFDPAGILNPGKLI